MIHRLLLACLLCGAGLASAGSAPADDRLIVVFDPTIEATSIDKLLEDFVEAVVKSKRIAERDRVVAWIATPGQTAPLSQRSFGVDRGPNGELAHAKAVRGWLAEIQTAFSGAWKKHRAGDSKARASCLVSMLFNIGTFLAGSHSSGSTDVFVISDMLEACSDWGDDSIDMEKTLGSTSVTGLVATLANATAKEIIHLEKVNNMYILLQSHSSVRTPIQVAGLQRAWSAVLKEFGLKNPPVFLSGMPDQLPGRR